MRNNVRQLWWPFQGHLPAKQHVIFYHFGASFKSLWLTPQRPVNNF
ncbi:hypothetical protein N624_1175 [Levilactobacillus brevis]|nr:hypothetical protein N624_1175 [Levilactobacillus brevis]